MAEQSVKVYIYDLSKGLARSMSMGFLGKQIDGIWHTGIVVFGQEFFFGGGGIESCAPGCLGIGQPDQIVEVGKSQIPFEVYMDYLQDLSTSTFKGECYHLLEHNCNTFSNELANFLTGNNIPSHITNLPQEVMNTPFGAMIKPMIDAMSVSPPGGSPLFSQQGGQTQQASPAAGGASASSAPAATGKRSTSSKPTYTNKKRLDEYSSARDELVKQLPGSDVKLLDEVFEYLSTEECSWGLGRQHLKILGSLMSSKELPESTQSAAGCLLQLALGKEDSVLLITHDPNMTIQKLIVNFDALSWSVKIRLLRGLCNLCLNDAGVQWLGSVEQQKIEGQDYDNNSACVKLCTLCLISENIEVASVGAALTFTFTASHKLSEDSAVDVGSALVQVLQTDIPEKRASHCLNSLLKSMDANLEVCSIASVMEFDAGKIATRLPALKELCNSVRSKIAQC